VSVLNIIKDKIKKKTEKTKIKPRKIRT